MRSHRRSIVPAALALVVLSPVIAVAEQAPPPPPNSRNCENTTPYEVWYRAFRRDAEASGIRARTISATLDHLTPDMSVIRRDRKQSFFTQTFTEFYRKLATESRYKMGRTYLKRHAKWFDKAEQDFGVPGAVITAFWALESDFGAGMGKLSVMRSLLTLAWDCRRGEMFREELKAALMLIDRGELTPDEMIGSWAGELGQTQFLPKHYLNAAIDYNGNGHRNLMREEPDIIGSTASFIQSMGWRRGEPWLEEVRVTKDLPWDKANLTVLLPRSQWAKWGIEAAERLLPADGLKASLVLPMGRYGPAFLAYENFRVYTQWNHSLTYAMTAAHLAARMAGAPPLSKTDESRIEGLNYEETKDLQRLLARRGHDVGEVDGKIGAATRSAVRAVQVEYGLPADSYPTRELLTRLRRGRS